jgi:3-hydroxyisobutyrate dehydrogenase
MAGTPTVGVLGTGIMGLPMAARLLAAGLTVQAWNRTPEKAAPLRDRGATVAGSAADAVAGADLVLTMLADGPAVADVMSGLGGALGPDTLWIQTSTVGVRYAERLAALAAELGVEYVDAPVLGTKQPAEQGKLVVLASGPEQLRHRCTPVFDAIGGRTLWVGEAGSASRLKLVVNSWVQALTGGAAEALALAGALGVDPQLFLSAIDGTPTDSRYAHVKGEAILSGSYPPSFPLSLAAKDARLVGEAAAETGLEVPLSSAVLAQFEKAQQLGHGAEDMAAVYHAYHQDPTR